MGDNDVMLSVIIPCYNNGGYLKEMIDCFKKQTSSQWEMIVVDDGSTDNTTEEITQYVDEIPQVHFLKRDRSPKGSVVCRNIGYEHAKGKYICHLDADDLVSDTFVEDRVSFMESHPDLDYASFPAKSFCDRNCLPSYEDPGYTWGEDKNCDILKEFLKGYDYPFSVWNNIYKKSSVKNLYWDETVLIYTDFSFIVPCILEGLKHQFSGMKRLDYFYRNVPNNKTAMTSNFVSKEKCQSTIYLFDKTLKSFDTYNVDKKYKKYFFVFFLTHFSRLILRNNNPELVKSFTDFAANYYPCKKRFTLVGKILFIKNPDRRHLMLSILYALLFGENRFLNTYWDSIKRRIMMLDKQS